MWRGCSKSWGRGGGPRRCARRGSWGWCRGGRPSGRNGANHPLWVWPGAERRGPMTHLPLQGDSSMWRNILKYGVIAGLVVAAGMWGTLLAFGGDMPHGWFGMALGYLSMLVALSAVFVGIKHHRDVDRGGVIRSEEHTSELQSLMRISYAG